MTEAENGQVALEQLAGTTFDAIVTDLMMPVLDGNELLERLRAGERTSRIPVIVYSSFVHAGVVADVILRKPCDPNDLVVAVSTVLGGGGA